jgi:hypothetical protein
MKKAATVRRRAGRRSVRTTSQSYDSSPLNPIRAKRDRGDDDGEDESETFRRRAEWWRLYHGDSSGIVSGNLRVQAIAHAEKLTAGGLDNPDPGGARPKSGFELVQRRGKGKAIRTKGARGRNPRPRSSFGFASDAIEVLGPVNLEGVVLKIALDPWRLRDVEPSTPRVFCFDAASGEWPQPGRPSRICCTPQKKRTKSKGRQQTPERAMKAKIDPDTDAAPSQ